MSGVEAVLAAHWDVEAGSDDWRCGCGERIGFRTAIDDLEAAHQAHVAAQLAAAGLTTEADQPRDEGLRVAVAKYEKRAATETARYVRAQDVVADLRALLTSAPDEELRAALDRVRALGDGWVGFDNSHHFGDAVLTAIGSALLADQPPTPDEGGAS
jgi:hypothetical protein